MLTVPAATCLLVSLPVIFSNLPSLPMLSAFLHRKVQRPPILHSLSTSHPPQATKAESAKSSRQNKKDTGPTYVTSINGILLPFLLRPKLRPAHSSTTANSTLFQIGLPLFPREDSLAEALELPPLAMEHSFYMPVSAIRGLFSQLLTVPLYRQPNTLGWPFLDSPIEPGDQWTSDTFLPLRNLLMLLPNFMPSAVQELLQTFQLNGTHFYNLSALSHLREKGILPGTRSDDMTSLYDWPLKWELRASLDDPFFSSLQSSDPENWQLLHKLGGHFLKRLIAALLAPNGHFPSLLLSTLWGIQGGFTSLCVQGIFGSGKTYCPSAAYGAYR